MNPLRKRSAAILLAAMLAAAACSDDRRRLRSALDAAGDNRPQLEQVLDRYGHDAADSLKLRAAEYLIRHMPLHRSYDICIERYYDAVDSLLPGIRDKESFKSGMAEIYRRCESQLNIRSDIRTLTADYLIRNIEQAFDLWENGRWATHLDFDEFCEYLLPYKCIELQPPTDWRTELREVCRGNIDRLERECKEFNNSASVAAQEINRVATGSFLRYTKQLDLYPIFRATTLQALPYGTCAESCTCAIQLMRSKGIPAAIDFTPQWPNRKYGHYWLAVLGMRHRSEWLTPFDIETSAHVNRPLSKVYRKTYRPEPELLRRMERRLPVPPSLRYLFFQDVSDQYMITDDIEVPLFRDRPVSENLYVATFNNQEWIPVAWGRRKGRSSVRFERLGRNVCYLPVRYTSASGVEAVGNPFHLDLRGRVRPIEADTTVRRSIRVSRKYPVYEFVYRNREKITGGVIEAADRPDFRGAKKIAEFPRDSLTLAGCQPLEAGRAYRYWRLRASDEGRCDMAELIFRDRSGRRLEGRLIRCGREVHPQNKVNLATAINDDDPLTFFSARGSDDIWVGFDFGAPVDPAEVTYFRRSDGNNFYPGYAYALSYWDGSCWHEIATRTADGSTFLDFDGVPDALLLLTCLTTGTESRPFLYAGDGRIEWF